MKSAIWMAFVVATALILAGMLLAVLSNSAYPATTAAPLLTPTPTYCPVATPEPFWVDPVTSPTDRFTQVITVYLGNGEAVTVTAESGAFTTTGPFYPASVTVALLVNTTHHLQVFGKVKVVGQWGDCVYGGYTLHTTRDRDGAPLVIEQRSNLTRTICLPLILRHRSSDS